MLNHAQPIALVGGFADCTRWHKGPVSRLYQSVPDDIHRIEYFQWYQWQRIRRWIDQYGERGIVYCHSYGAHDTMRLLAKYPLYLQTLVTVDPVGRLRPDFSAVAKATGLWINLQATHQHTFADLVAFVGSKYGSVIADYIRQSNTLGVQNIDLYKNHANVFDGNIFNYGLKPE